MKKVASESYQKQKGQVLCHSNGRYWQKGCMIPMSFDVMKIFQDAGLS